MKFFVFTILLFFLACSSQEQKIIEESQRQQVIEAIPWQTENKPKIYRDENGNIINEDGWEIPKNLKIISIKNIIDVVDGKKLKRQFIRYELKERFFTKNPFFFVANDKVEIFELTSLQAFKGKNQKPYCYSSIAHRAKKDEKTNQLVSFGMGVICRFCDKDGDGKYETFPIKNFQFRIG